MKYAYFIISMANIFIRVPLLLSKFIMATVDSKYQIS